MLAIRLQIAYDAAMRAARLRKIKGAHDELIGAAYCVQADALDIEAQAKRRLADEYDAVQPEAAKLGGRPKTVPDENGFTASDAGLTRKEIHEARIIRDAEKAANCDAGNTDSTNRLRLDSVLERRRQLHADASQYCNDR